MTTMTFDDYAKKIHGLNDFLSILDIYGINYKKENNRYNANCPLHTDKTPSFFVYEENKKAKYKCFGCNKSGDIIDFVQEKENISKFEALKMIYNNLSLILDFKPNKIEKLEQYIYKKKQLEGYKIESIYIYELEDYTPSFLKIKYRNLTLKTDKTMRTYKLIDEGEYYRLALKSKEGDFEHTIYNYPKVKQALQKQQNIYIVEGEKDVETLRKLGLVATTIYSKKWQDIYNEQLQGAKVVFIGDTGEAGEQYKELMWQNLKKIAKSFKIVTLPELEQLGENKDVTDWLESGHTRNELLDIAENRTLDLLNKFELQQDKYGIYKTVSKKVDDDYIDTKVYISNFNILSCELNRNQDTNEQIIKFKIKSNIGYITIVEANARECFTDIRTFKKYIGVDFIFTGTIVDLTELQRWIIQYFIVKDVKNYTITGIRKIENEYVLVTNNGILYKNGIFDTNIKAINPYHDINFIGATKPTKEEAKKLKKYLLNFNDKINVYNTLGLGIAYMLNTFVRKSNKDNLPVLQDIGESNSGKSKAFDILRGLYGNETRPIDYAQITQFSIQKALSDTYLPIFVDELKPSKASSNKLNVISSFVRAVTEGYTAFKGNKNQTLNIYELRGTLMLSGEEEIEETAIKNRSNIIWYSKQCFSQEGLESINFICNSEEGQKLLKKLSYSLYLHVLNNYSPEVVEAKYEEIKNKYEYNILIPSNRECNTAIYTTMGLELLFDTLEELGCRILEETRYNAAITIAKNILDNVIGGNTGEGTKAEYEIILEAIDHLAGIDDMNIKIIRNKDFTIDDNIISLKIPSIWDKLERYYKTYKIEKLPINKNTFTKTLRKSKYFIEYGNNYFINYEEARDGSIHAVRKRAKAYKLDINKLLELDINDLIEYLEDSKIARLV